MTLSGEWWSKKINKIAPHNFITINQSSPNISILIISPNNTNNKKNNKQIAHFNVY